MRSSSSLSRLLNPGHVGVWVTFLLIYPACSHTAFRPKRGSRGEKDSRAAASVTSLYAAGPRGQSTAAEAPTKNRHCSLLVFWAVSAGSETVSLVKRNIEHLHSSLRTGCRADVFLAHYDRRSWWWKKQAGFDWYTKHVMQYANQAGFKFQLAQDLLANVTLKPYDWVWVLDEDIDFTGTDVRRMLDVARKSGALIALPSFTQRGATTMDRIPKYPFNSPDNDCEYRYVNVVEYIFPLLKPSVFKLLRKCNHCIHEHSAWGLDRTWCAFAAGKINHNTSTVCAILDSTPVVHLNFRTLKGKYDLHEVRHSFQQSSKIDMDDVRAHHPLEFVALPGNLISRCVERLSH
mmetsp:Transcript_86951/g.246532  ORF Transcript_86951/g.246532 Transcript_86951/m.246532 type:complete len:347 (+) Transcript_86951:39-1079(+)